MWRVGTMPPANDLQNERKAVLKAAGFPSTPSLRPPLVNRQLGVLAWCADTPLLIQWSGLAPISTPMLKLHV